ncbi:hypothetical protein STRDD10_00860 [Streptococcus sp. DD10]|nr:hypothetical protein [Streptococcus sp. DD10]KXT74572.1 hypothetical protein STRDD10_00860 [Streptococcus sp. DD10]
MVVKDYKNVIEVIAMKEINKFPALSIDELMQYRGGDNPYGITIHGIHSWEEEPVMIRPVHGNCPLGTYNLGYIGGGDFLCKGSSNRF